MLPSLMLPTHHFLPLLFFPKRSKVDQREPKMKAIVVCEKAIRTSKGHGVLSPGQVWAGAAERRGWPFKSG